MIKAIIITLFISGSLFFYIGTNQAENWYMSHLETSRSDCNLNKLRGQTCKLIVTYRAE